MEQVVPLGMQLSTTPIVHDHVAPAICRTAYTTYWIRARQASIGNCGSVVRCVAPWRTGLTDTMLGATFYDERTVAPGAVHVLSNEPSFYPVRAGNHRPPQIAGG